MKTICFLSLLILAASHAGARTWFVERDGSGDFATIPDAIAAAASGDTIRIGPGRFNEGIIEVTPGWTEFVRILVHQEELTLIGAGGDQTIVGQEAPYDLSQGRHRGIQTGSYWGSRRLVVEGIRFENMAYAINDEDLELLVVRNCSFSGSYYSLISDAEILEISGCVYASVTRDGAHIVAWDQERLTLANCSFTLVPDGLWAQIHVGIHGVAKALVTDCEFRGGAGGFSASSGSHVRLDNCLFDGQTTTGIYGAIACTVIMTDCTVRDQKVALWMVSESSTWEVRNTTISDVSLSSLSITGMGNGYFRDCSLAKGPQYAVMYGFGKSEGGNPSFDMRRNWWGTTDPDSIAAWIYDGNDEPGVGFVIAWEPFLDQPVTARNSSFGDLKQAYR